MSFILDAIQKSEQERRQVQSERLQSWYHQPVVTKSPQPTWIVLLLIVNCVAVLGLGVWLFWSSLGVELVSEHPMESAATTIDSETQIDPMPQEPVQTAPAPVLTEAPLVITPSQPQRRSQIVKPPSVEIPALESLPESMMIHIPAIAFSSHLFSSAPEYREVVVNGQKLREGDYLTSELQLVEIEEKGVVFQQFNQHFRVSLARYWVQD